MFRSFGFSLWGLQICALAGAVACFGAMLWLLYFFDGKDVFEWQGVTLNTIVSILSVVIKSSVVFVVADCMAQWKWILFAREERLLIDFDRIDGAVRGPLGCFRVILRTHGAWVVQFGALLAILAIGLDPFAQQLIRMEPDVFFTPSNSSTSGPLALNSYASACAMGRTMKTVLTYNISGDAGVNITVSTQLPLSMQGTIFNSLSRSPAEAEQEALVRRPTSNCTFDRFTTVGICHRCNDVSSSLQAVRDFSDVYYAIPNTWRTSQKGSSVTAFVLPNGQFIANPDGCSPYNDIWPERLKQCKNASVGAGQREMYAVTAYGTGSPKRTVSMGGMDALLWSTSIIHPSLEVVSKPVPDTWWVDNGTETKGIGFWPDIPMKATECALYYCVKDVESTIQGNQLREVVTERVEFRRHPNSFKRLEEIGDKNRIPEDEADSLEFDSFWSAVEYSDLQLASTLDGRGARYNISSQSVKALSSHFQGLFRGQWNNDTDLRAALDAKLGRGKVGFNGASTGPLRENQGGIRMRADPPALDGLWGWSRNDVESNFAALATSMTNEVRRNPRPSAAPQSSNGQPNTGFSGVRDGALSLYGSVGSSTTLYRIEWPWIALHGSMLVFSLSFLCLTASSSGGRGGVPLWKSSSLAAIRHGHEVGVLLMHTDSVRGMEETARKISVKVSSDGRDDRGGEEGWVREGLHRKSSERCWSLFVRVMATETRSSVVDATGKTRLRDSLERANRDEGPSIGQWLRSPTILLAQILGPLAEDWVVVDTGQYGDMDGHPNLMSQVLHIAHSGASPIVRISTSSPWTIWHAARASNRSTRNHGSRLRDKAEAIVSACKYRSDRWLKGTRRTDDMVSSGTFKQDPREYRHSANDNIIVCVQIATRKAVENVEEIATVDGIDMLFVGPNDVAASMESAPFDHVEIPEVNESAAARVLKAGLDVGKYVGHFAIDAEVAAARCRQGFHFVNCGADIVAIQRWTFRETGRLRRLISEDGIGKKVKREREDSE
ncbi:hypothetical protein CSOJ01_06516 [Colletotrichum sojae]|uniref:HpcH/HpaI aldolase/citrate lyase domain-containing protein n=1 Tax=Colletotrichum sojae TaxID=2175907 RepID=A0A8H6JBK8_9PEZI|nr:hypothetical protein CSOJ01_06516 [Colletotrichum sojae]